MINQPIRCLYCFDEIKWDGKEINGVEYAEDGDLISSDAWNAVIAEIERLGGKVEHKRPFVTKTWNSMVDAVKDLSNKEGE